MTIQNQNTHAEKTLKFVCCSAYFVSLFWASGVLFLGFPRHLHLSPDTHILLVIMVFLHSFWLLIVIMGTAMFAFSQAAKNQNTICTLRRQIKKLEAETPIVLEPLFENYTELSSEDVLHPPIECTTLAVHDPFSKEIWTSEDASNWQELKQHIKECSSDHQLKQLHEQVDHLSELVQSPHDLRQLQQALRDTVEGARRDRTREQKRQLDRRMKAEAERQLAKRLGKVQLQLVWSKE